MSLKKNKYPILEYDTDFEAIVMPGADKPALPEKCVVTFSDYAERYAEQVNAQICFEFVSCTRIFTIYTCTYNGHPVCFCDAPAGASAATQLVDFLFLSGVTQLIASGSCGTLIDIAENEILIPVKALRAEGTSYHYLEPDRFVNLNTSAIVAIEQALNKASITYRKCITWSTDGFFRETRKIVQYRKEEGCQVVEMECSALASCAQFRKRIFGQILFSGDSLADTEKHDQRNWGMSSIEQVFRASLEAVTLIKG
jgi:uridine phosphorylase